MPIRQPHQARADLVSRARRHKKTAIQSSSPTGHTLRKDGDIFLYQASQPKNRPTGIVIIAVLWTLSSIFNIFQGLNILIVDLGALPLLSDPRTHKWLSFGLPAEILLGFFVVAFGFLTLLVVYGLFTAKSWSYDFALALPVFITVINIVTLGLYASAPLELGLRAAADGVFPFIALNLVWLVIVWAYLTRPHVRQYLKQIPTPPPTKMPIPPTPSTLSVPPPPEPAVMSEEKKFCRYCGEENKTDAIFCERCGKKIG